MERVMEPWCLRWLKDLLLPLNSKCSKEKGMLFFCFECFNLLFCVVVAFNQQPWSSLKRFPLNQDQGMMMI
uniref:Uncharacterized protein n=1 Tax=Kalanchoe fedtschenkoi TaxID=63787 RepID=A0A7N0U3L1_KALFE